MKAQLSYMDSMHRWGKIWGLGVAAVIFAVPVIVSIIFGCMPEWAALGKALFAHGDVSGADAHTSAPGEIRQTVADQIDMFHSKNPPKYWSYSSLARSFRVCS